MIEFNVKTALKNGEDVNWEYLESNRLEILKLQKGLSTVLPED